MPSAAAAAGAVVARRKETRKPTQAAHEEQGQGTVELALAVPLVLLVLLGVVQFALVAHARDVATTAAQEGAHLAATAGGSSVADTGTSRAREVLQAGLGQAGSTFQVTAQATREDVVVRAQGDYPLIIPWVRGNEISIVAVARARREGFRSGP
jgi:Flp pilus assembly protein TadG